MVDPDNTYMTDEFIAERSRRALAKFTELDLAVPAGSLTSQFETTLVTLAESRRELYSWTAFSAHPDDNGAVLVASSGRDAVRLITDNQSVRLDPVAPRELAESLVDALPGYVPARVRQLSVPKAYLDGTDSYGDDPLTEASEQADELRHLMRGERVAVHQLYAAVRHNGERARSTPLSAIDLTGRGRVLSFVSATAAGTSQVIVCTGNRRNLVDALNLTLDALG
ncbi:ESX secretion-associated protein EspG [Amycolatopsis ultiminotia]|uniref:ESX secretion-associated protein EspG n=1 Tax=Amycolatopsis ultiminotia TaxID=543629 RepID=A0ABP6Y0Z8_9PSEU